MVKTANASPLKKLLQKKPLQNSNRERFLSVFTPFYSFSILALYRFSSTNKLAYKV